MRLLKKLKRIFRPRAAVLMYHRIGEVDNDPWELAVSCKNFEQHLQVLIKRYNVIPVKELVRQVNEGRIKRNSVCITFDDGYRDNLINAVPLLKKYNCPATFFVATGFTGTEKMFWWDTLNEVAGENYISAWQELQPLSSYEIDIRIQSFINNSGKQLPVEKLSYPMNKEELAQLSSDKLFSLAAHTITHPALAMHNASTQEHELVGSREFLYSGYDNYIDTVAYPYGNYNEITISLMRNNNFEAGFTTEERNVAAHADIYRLGRFQVKNINGDEFRKQLHEWISQ